MYKFYFWVMAVVNCLLGMAAALIVLDVPATDDAQSAILRMVASIYTDVSLGGVSISGQVVRVLAGGVLFFAELVLVASAIFSLRRKSVRDMRFRTEDGDTVLAAATVEEFMERSLRDRGDVSSTDVRLTVDARTRRPSRVRAAVVLSEAANLVEVANSIRDDLKTCLTRLIPVPEKIPIEVRPRVLAVRSVQKPPGENRSSVLFKRPEYPIDKD